MSCTLVPTHHSWDHDKNPSEPVFLASYWTFNFLLSTCTIIPRITVKLAFQWGHSACWWSNFFLKSPFPPARLKLEVLWAFFLLLTTLVHVCFTSIALAAPPVSAKTPDRCKLRESVIWAHSFRGFFWHSSSNGGQIKKQKSEGNQRQA